MFDADSDISCLAFSSPTAILPTNLVHDLNNNLVLTNGLQLNVLVLLPQSPSYLPLLLRSILQQSFHTFKTKFDVRTSATRHTCSAPA